LAWKMKSLFSCFFLKKKSWKASNKKSWDFKKINLVFSLDDIIPGNKRMTRKLKTHYKLC
jgi:hypothetical protein